MDNPELGAQSHYSASDGESQCQMNLRLDRLARNREALREMRAILGRIYGKSAITTFKSEQS